MAKDFFEIRISEERSVFVNRAYICLAEYDPSGIVILRLDETAETEWNPIAVPAAQATEVIEWLENDNPTVQL